MHRKAWLVVLGTAFGCHGPIRGWADLARTSGCTPELIASAPSYQASEVQALAGQYSLVQIDTARGWFEFERKYATIGRYPTLTLWATDSLHRVSRVNPLTKRRIPADLPLAGALSGYEHAGFTPDRPQVELSGPRYNMVVIRFQPEIVLDAPLWELPVERIGGWGFGGYFAESSIVVPMGTDGQALGQRAGFYCAFKR